MRAFAAGEIDVLVSTTVIEVGVDVANATDDGGLGRRPVRRLPAPPAARAASAGAGCPGCACWSPAPRPGSPARDRLDAVAATTDGFELSRVDLEQRREGDVLGASQSGFRSSLQTLRVLRDEETILAARERGRGACSTADPDLAGAPLLAAAVARTGAIRAV